MLRRYRAPEIFAAAYSLLEAGTIYRATANSLSVRSLLRLRAGGLLPDVLRNRNALFRRQQRDENVTFHARHGFDLAELADLYQQAIHLRAADFLVRHFAAAVKNHRANFVAFAKKTDDLVFANLIIVFGGRGPELYFLELRTTAALALFVRFFVGLVKIFAVVRDFTNRRVGGGRNFHQIEPALTRQFHGFKGLHDAELAALFINHPDLSGANAFIDADAVALPEAAFCDKTPLSSERRRSARLAGRGPQV